MADELSVSRVSDTPRDGGKPNGGARGKRRPAPPRPAAPPAAKDDPTTEAPTERKLDLLV